MNTITVYSDMVTLGTSGKNPGDVPTRSEVSGFSRKSRLRLMKLMAAIQDDMKNALFITLTYPDIFPLTWDEWKRHIAVFRKRLLRRFPGCGGIWRVELQTRKSGKNKGKSAPHFHLVVVGVKHPMKKLRKWLAETWYEIVNSGDYKHYQAGTQCDLLKSRRQAYYYVSKYMAKPQGGLPVAIGRVWGRFGALNCEPVHEREVSSAAAIRFVELARAWAWKENNRRLSDYLSDWDGGGVTIFGLGADSETGQMVWLLIRWAQSGEVPEFLSEYRKSLGKNEAVIS